MSASAIFAGSAQALRERSPSAIFQGSVASLRERAPSAIFSAEVVGIPGASSGDTVEHPVELTPSTSGSDTVQAQIDPIPTGAGSDTFEFDTTFTPGASLSPVHDDITDEIPGAALSSGDDDITEAFLMGIRAKQLTAGTFTSAEVTRTFASGAISGTELANDSIDENKLAATAFDASLVGGGGTQVGLETDTTNFAPTFSGTGAWTFPVNNLQVTGTPDSVNDVVNKNYVDNQVSGITWKEPVCVLSFIGERTITQINALTPATGDAVVATDAGTPTAGTSDALVAGDLAEFNGTSWIKLYDAVTGQLAAGLRLIASTTSALFSPLTDGVDDGKVLLSVADPGTINGTVSDFNDTGDGSDGNAALIQCDEGAAAESTFENTAYVYDGAVPTGSWIQFTGGGALNGGAGLSLSGNTINIGDVNRGVQVNADDLEIDGSEIAGNGLAENVTNSWQLDVDPAQLISGGNAEVNGDLLDVDGITYNNITPVTSQTGSQVNPATLTDHLAAHLIGIDNALDAAGGTPQQEQVTSQNITGTDTALTDTLNNTPTSNGAVKLYLNGILLTQGAGADYTVSGTTITWLASSGTAPDLDTADVLIAVYES